jgi:simple sugar transport system substrate-binding protein
MYASILWDPGEAAYAMVYIAKLILEGKRASINASLDIPTLGKPLSFTGNTLIYDRPLVVTKDNLDQYNTF